MGREAPGRAVKTNLLKVTQKQRCTVKVGSRPTEAAPAKQRLHPDKGKEVAEDGQSVKGEEI
jgi:hypothetical protein